MTNNLGSLDRVLRFILGAALVFLPLLGVVSFGSLNWLVVLVGVVFVATAAMKFCPLYRIFGIRTCKL